MGMVGLFIGVSAFMLSSAAMAAEPAKSGAIRSQGPAAAVSPSSIQFNEISVNFQKTDVVIAYKTPASIRLICQFTDQRPILNASHSVGFYINNNKVYDNAQFKGNTVVQDVDMPPEGTYTFKCVVDAKSIALPFKVAKYSYETCRPSVTVHMIPDRNTLTMGLGIATDIMDDQNPPYTLNVPNAPDQILSLTGSTIVPPGNEVRCIYGTALTYKKKCKQAKKVANQHKYECLP
jgi:hypothetical protein